MLFVYILYTVYTYSDKEIHEKFSRKEKNSTCSLGEKKKILLLLALEDRLTEKERQVQFEFGWRRVYTHVLVGSSKWIKIHAPWCYTSVENICRKKKITETILRAIPQIADHGSAAAAANINNSINNIIRQ